MKSSAILLCTAAALLVTACAAPSVAVVAHIPPPLLTPLPLKMGLQVSGDFANQVQKEPIGSEEWRILLGAAQVAAFKRVAGAMFRESVPFGEKAGSAADDKAREKADRQAAAEAAKVAKAAKARAKAARKAGASADESAEEKPAAPASPPPPPIPVPPGLDAVLEASLDSFTTLLPTSSTSYYSATVGYRFDLRDADGKQLGSWIYEGYGSVPSRAAGQKTGVAEAAGLAMRDAFANMAVHLPEQEILRKLLPNEAPEAAK